MSRMFSPAIAISIASLLSAPLGSPGVALGQGGAGNNQPQPGSRPAGAESEPLPPRLEQILVEWSNATKKIEKLEGQHVKHVYDSVFAVEKLSRGKFYYEAPDKGRIDIEPEAVKAGAVSQRVDPKTRKPFKLMPDTAERWVCTGKNILKIDDEGRKVQYFPIPPENQGQRIMDGPLPFLFGMPPELAKRRYDLTLISEGRNETLKMDVVRLRAVPKWKQDAANYKEANVILSKATWLPVAVQLVDPTGNAETVYRFHNVTVNKKRSFFEGNPFDIKLGGYTREMIGGKNSDAPNQATPRRAAPPDRSQTPQRTASTGEAKPVPDVRGLPYKEAQAKLAQAGFTSECRKGRAVTDERYVYRVENQSPEPQTQLAHGAKVSLTLYVKPADLQSADRTSARDR